MRYFILAAALVVAVTSSGCATRAPRVKYPIKPDVTFDVLQLDQNAFKISGEGNSKATLEFAQDMILRESAYVTHVNGFRYFVVANNEASTDQTILRTPSTSYTSVYSGSATTRTQGGHLIMRARPQLAVQIVCFKERPSVAQGVVYDAKVVHASVSDRYDKANAIAKYDEEKRLEALPGYAISTEP